MDSVIEELKAQARVLHRQAQHSDPAALARLKPVLSQSEADASTQVLRRHCLGVIARELGFSGWPHAVSVIRGDNDTDFGTLLYPRGASTHTNIWCASYAEAREIREQNDGYLLAYKHQYFIVDRHFIAMLGIDPDAPEWNAIGRDWVRPADPQARQRLYAMLIRRRPGQSQQLPAGSC